MESDRDAFNSGEVEPIEKIMTASLAEFYRSLARLFPSLEIEDGQSVFVIWDNGRRVEIVVEELPPRTVGVLLSLPQLRVKFSFERYGDSLKAEFIAAFDKVFLRGGG